ncbi:MAG TPA: response regulator [Verrucomicrobiae bacterium]|nr:response regulator [Verrucomicrobiae bacterium]
MMPTRTFTTERDPLVEAIELARLGQKGEARQLLREACRIDPGNAKAWLWSASLAETVADAINDLQQVVALDPDNATARGWLERLRPSVVEVPWYQCFLCSYEGLEEFDRCPQCHSVLSLDLDETFRNQGLDERQVRLAVDRLGKLAGSADPFDIEYYLGVAHLNLLNSQAALEHFRRAEALDERGAQLRATIAALSRRPLVMAVDDCLTIRTMVTSTLERNGYRCLSAASSVDALSYLEDATPEFVLLDVSMPFMDGYLLAKTIKSQPKTKDTTVVMLSARDGFMDKVKGRMSGAADYLTKPFEPALLLRIIRKYVHPKE